MAYELHIERRDAPITVDEWRAVVAEIPNLRLSSTDLVATNPMTGERIFLPRSPGDTELALENRRWFGLTVQREWTHAFGFYQERATFRPPISNSPQDPIRVAASRLASALEAEIVGDQGERYDW